MLALLTLTTCAVRLLLAFFQLRELAAVRALALTDELTGAPNRRALYVALDRVCAETAAGRARTGFSLALIDLDHFKEVNDSFGHATGDELLQAVVERYTAALVQLQTPHLLARLGGDEFAVILYEADSHNAAMACGSALEESLAEPIELRDVVLHAQASIGIATSPEHGETRGDMLFAADAAMYSAKSSGRPLAYHSPSAVGDRRQRLIVAEDLYTALDRRELTVEYQPVLTVEGALVGCEALVRWDHPTRGRLSPAEFLEAAERYKLTPAIAERVLDVSLGDLARWRRGGTRLTMSVNVSASDLRDESLVKIVASALLTHDVPPEALTIEITETAMMRNPEQAQLVMQALSDLGVQLSVDDYGTGYSSLEYLLKLPINEIKLDRAFCADIVTELRGHRHRPLHGRPHPRARPADGRRGRRERRHPVRAARARLRPGAGLAARPADAGPGVRDADRPGAAARVARAAQLSVASAGRPRGWRRRASPTRRRPRRPRPARRRGPRPCRRRRARPGSAPRRPPAGPADRSGGTPRP